ncbi:hypothetical protein EST38_g3087 [Candolleomyces aberdarensis]|uniref:F-box domain-containing protein n=1 Tax=Candolleomyces aberdarensis TaxID=2316362 RepID=A0A4Q2DTX4_9AGAR|nr:hypothetical protein EST38_g3087 [Candolleomyces aberdarensis]
MFLLATFTSILPPCSESTLYLSGFMKLFAKRSPSNHDSKTESTNGALILSDPLGSLTNLPHELLLQILDELDDAALFALGATCKNFNNLVFPWFFDKYKIARPLQGWISCYKAPEHTLRAIRCSLSTKNISRIYYYFNKGIDRLVEEVEEMHAIVRKTDEVTEFKVYLTDPDDWAIARDVRRLDRTQVLRLTLEEWTVLYLGLLTAALTKGCQHMRLGGGGPFLEYLRDRDRRQAAMADSVPTSPGLPSKERAFGSTATRYFDGTFPYASPLAGQPKSSLLAQSVEKLPPENTAVAENTVSQVLEGNSASNPPTPLFESTKKRPRHGLLKRIEFSKKNKNRSEVEAIVSSTAAHNPKDFDIVSPGSSFTGLSDINKSSAQPKAPAPAHTMSPPAPKIRTLILKSDMLFASPSFLDWTNQLLSWCGSTLKHLELQCLETPSGVWCKFFSEVSLPSLVSFGITCNRIVGGANVQGSDILRFLCKHPNIRKLYLHGIQVPACRRDLAQPGKLPILPNLVAVTAHPMYIRLLLHDKKQCPMLKKVVFLTECYASLTRPFAYDVLDKALNDLLPRSHQLDLIGFKFTNDRYDLDSWLQSHVDAGPNASILSSFINMKHLQINAAHYVRIVKSASRLDLVAQVAGLFPNLDYLELKDQPGVPYNKTDYIPPVIEALRRHSPQVKRVKINNQDPIDIAEFESSEKE